MLLIIFFALRVPFDVYKVEC